MHYYPHLIYILANILIRHAVFVFCIYEASNAFESLGGKLLNVFIRVQNLTSIRTKNKIKAI